METVLNAERMGDSSWAVNHLSETFLSSPHRGVNDLEEQLARPRVEDENGPVDRLRRQVALERLVDGHPVHVRVVDKPAPPHEQRLETCLENRSGRKCCLASCTAPLTNRATRTATRQANNLPPSTTSTATSLALGGSYRWDARAAQDTTRKDSPDNLIGEQLPVILR